MDKTIKKLKMQSEIYRKLADLNDKIVVAMVVENEEELESLAGQVMVQYIKLQKLGE